MDTNNVTRMPQKAPKTDFVRFNPYNEIKSRWTEEKRLHERTMQALEASEHDLKAAQEAIARRDELLKTSRTNYHILDDRFKAQEKYINSVKQENGLWKNAF